MLDPFAGVKNLRDPTSSMAGAVRKELRRRRISLAGSLPRALRRQRGPRLGSLPVVAVAGAGLAVVAGLLLWDDRRRAAMRRRLEEVTGSFVTHSNRVAEPTPAGVRPD